MTISVTFLNDATKQPDVYIDRADLNSFTLTVSSDNPTPIDVTTLRIRFPVKIFTVDTIMAVVVKPSGWSPVPAGPYLTLTPPPKTTLSSGSPMVINLSGVKTDNPAATTDEVQVNAASQAPTTKIFSQRYPVTARELTQQLLPDLSPKAVYRTPANHNAIENVTVLRLSNTSPNAPLVTNPWVRTPTINVSFVYGDDIGSLTPADDPTKDPYSAFNIAIEVEVTYKDGKQTYEWTVTPPDPGVTDKPPVWVLQPVPENTAVLGTGAGATAAFRISGLSTVAPVGDTVVYLQYADFPGYNDGYLTRSLEKAEAVPSIVYFDGDPAWVAKSGDQVTVRWQTFGMDRIELLANGQPVDGGGGPFDPTHDSYTQSIKRTTPFALRAYFASGDKTPAHTAEWTGHVPDAAILSFSANAETTVAGAPVRFTWSTRAALSAGIRCSAEPLYPIPDTDLAQGSKIYHPRVPATYTLHVDGEGNPPDQSLMVLVLPHGWSSRSMGFNPNAGQGPVMFGTDDGLVLVGGQSDNAVYACEDGITWSQTGEAQFPPRNNLGGCMLGGKPWIMGGLSNGQPMNDVWRCGDDGTWTQVAAAAGWSARSRFGCIAFNQKLWVLGGVDQNLQTLGDIWCSSDGVAWSKIPDAARWSARSSPALAVYQNKLWLFGGLLADGTSVSNELWVSDDGSTWTQQRTGDRFNAIVGRSAGIMAPIGPSLYLFGGVGQDGKPLNDFHVFGRSWGLATGPSGAWNVHEAGFTVWRGALWIAGGLAGDASNDAVWTYFS